MATSLQALSRLLVPGVVTSAYYLLTAGARISHRAEVDLTANLSFGRSAVVGSYTKIKAFGGPVTFGNRAGIATGCFLASGEKGIKVGDNFICGANVNIVATNYRHGDLDTHLEDLGSVSKGIVIGSNVWIGSGTTVTDGAVIGNNTIVSANSLVTRRYPDNVILQGNPAKVVMKRSR